MFRYLIITVFSFFVFSSIVSAGSDGEIELKNNQPKQIKDCFEPLNRATFSFNQGLDKIIIKPVAKSYRKLPEPVQKGTGNALKNLSNLITIPNNILQGDIKLAFINTARLAVNTTVGLLGTIDVANKIGFPKYEKEDYGQTLGVWGVMHLAVATESDIIELESYEERQMFLDDLGLEEPGVNRVIRAAYRLLHLQTYFTAGVKEVRAWTIQEGFTAPQAAGVIHSDFEKGFIRAEVIAYQDYVHYKSEAAVKEAGKMRVEGKEYRVKDGDVMHFRFNV